MRTVWAAIERKDGGWVRISELCEADSHAQEGVSAVMALSDRIVVSG